jgi:DNA-binding response OmpR family regulator
MISGASDYMLKPLQPEAVTAGLEIALKKKRLESAMCSLSASTDFRLGGPQRSLRRDNWEKGPLACPTFCTSVSVSVAQR